MFTRSTVQKTEYSKVRNNLTIDEQLLKEPTLALEMAVSAERGVEYC